MSKPFKRLFFDIEVSPNLGFFWGTGNKISVGYDMIVQERAIICICYKYEGNKRVYSLAWNKGDDYKLVKEFASVINDADEVIGHNGDNFDIKWVRTRCLLHGVKITPFITSIDTLKLSRSQFRFNSNRLDYLGKLLGVGGKTETNLQMWKDIVLHNDEKQLDRMIKYCKNDVLKLEDIYHRFEDYIKPKTHIGAYLNRDRVNCAHCGSDQTVINKRRISATGTVNLSMQCRDCFRYFQITEGVYNRAMKLRK